MFGAKYIVSWITFHHRGITIPSIEKTILTVAAFIAYSVLEHLPTLLSMTGGITILPWVQTDSTISAIVVTKLIVTLLMANVVPFLCGASILFTFQFFGIHVPEDVRVDHIDTTFGGGVIDLTVLASPSLITVAIKVTQFVNASTLLARTVLTLIQAILFTLLSTGSMRTNASVSRVPIDTGSTIMTRRAVTTFA